MKKLTNKSHMAFKTILLMVSALFVLVNTVSAQRFSTTSTTKQTDEFFANLMTEERAANDTFLDAYEDYIAALDQFVLNDIASDARDGSTASDVYYDFDASVDGEYYEMTDTETYMSYLYQVDGENYAELLFYFVEESLIYIGLTNLQVDIDLSEFVPNATMQEWVDGQVYLSDLEGESFRIAGISKVLNNGTYYNMMMVPSGDSEDALYVDYMIFYNDYVYESYMLDFYYSFEAPQDNMIQYFAYFLGYSDEFPIAP